MLNMKIEGIEIRNYRVFRHVVIKDLSRLMAVVGANGSGKSTLFDVFIFLKDALTHNVVKAVRARGGPQELVSRGEFGPITIILNFRNSSGQLITYELEITVGLPFIAHREILKLRRGQGEAPLHLLDFKNGRGFVVADGNLTGQLGALNNHDHRSFLSLDDPATLAIKGLGQFKEFRVASELREFIENWHISDVQVAEARPSIEGGYSEHLSTRGENVAQVAQFLYEKYPNHFEKILEAMKRRVPGVEKVEAKSMEDGRLVLRFQDGAFKDPFIARYVSDGTIKMFEYLVLLHDPKPFPLLAVEEPENQLYPELLPELAEEFRDYARRGGQVFISTHSPDFLNGLKLDEIYWLSKKNGFTDIRRASDSEILRNLAKEGDLPGALWKQGLFEAMERI